jgi:glutaminase
MSPLSKVINKIDKTYKQLKNKKFGKMPDYIPSLKKGNPKTFAITFITNQGESYSIGDSSDKVTIQSISKVLILANVINNIGVNEVVRKIGLDGNPFPFNSLLGAVVTESKTISPFTNQGALATTSLLYHHKQSQYKEDVVDTISKFIGKKTTVDTNVAKSDLQDNTTNRALAWILASYGKITSPVHDVLDAYTTQCAVLVDSCDIAMAAATLSNGGVNPVTGHRVIKASSATGTIRYLDSVSMPNAEAQWDIQVGPIPAKSGVGGGILIIIPGVGGLGVVSPPLNKDGISAKGFKAAVAVTKAILHAYKPSYRAGYSVPRRRKSSKVSMKGLLKKRTLRHKAADK